MPPSSAKMPVNNAPLTYFSFYGKKKSTQKKNDSPYFLFEKESRQRKLGEVTAARRSLRKKKSTQKKNDSAQRSVVAFRINSVVCGANGGRTTRTFIIGSVPDIG